MSRISLAFRLFFQALSGKIEEARVDLLTAPTESRSATSAVTERHSERSDAIDLLAALQRDARFVDLVQESLSEYSDAQVGAAARDVLRDCRNTLDKIFGLQPVIDQPENASVEVNDKPGIGNIRLTGNVSGPPPYRGKLVHHGWQTTKCSLPTFTGSSDASRIVAPAEIEIPSK